MPMLSLYGRYELEATKPESVVITIVPENDLFNVVGFIKFRQTARRHFEEVIKS